MLTLNNILNISAFYQHLLRPTKLTILANTNNICKTQISADYISQAKKHNLDNSELRKAQLRQF